MVLAFETEELNKSLEGMVDESGAEVIVFSLTFGYSSSTYFSPVGCSEEMSSALPVVIYSSI